MTTLLTVDIDSGTALLNGEAWVPRAWTFDEDPTLALRFTRQTGEATEIVDLDIVSTQASIGLTDLRPLSGTWALQVGAGPSSVANTTGDLGYDAPVKEVQDAMNALAWVISTYGTVKVRKVDGSWLITFGDGGAEVPLQVRRNSLQPVSLGRSSAYTLDAQWQHEVRLVQAPLAFTDVTRLVLPPVPTIKEIDKGSMTLDGSNKRPEIQALTVPPNFRALYCLKTGAGAQTIALSPTDDDEVGIQAALETILGRGNVHCDLVANGVVHIYFQGALIGQDIAELEVVPLNPPPGDLTLTLHLDRAPLLARLRVSDSVVAPLEVKLRYQDETGTTRKLVAIRQDVVIRRPVNWPELALVPAHDYLRPLSPKSYVPFSPDTVITGHQFFPAVVGDGAATEFTVDHGLNSEAVFVFVRENNSEGRQLVQGADYEVRLAGDDSVVVTALGDEPPELNAWAIIAFSAQTVAAFAAGLTVTMGQVTGLNAALSTLATMLADLQQQAATVPLGIKDATTVVPITIEIPDCEWAFPGNIQLVSGKYDPSTLTRIGWLLPAIHDAAATAIATEGALPSIAVGAGNAYQNNTGAPMLVKGGLGTADSYVTQGGFLGSDGRRFYPLSRAGTSTSYFPRDFERTLFTFDIDSQMLRAGTAMSLSFSFAYQLLLATSRAQYYLVIEHGTSPSETTPATTSGNLGPSTWNATPMLRQRLVMAENKVTRTFGVQIIRAAAGTLAANKQIDGFLSAAGSVPASADFSLRGRVIDFDGEGEGTVFFALANAKTEIF